MNTINLVLLLSWYTMSNFKIMVMTSTFSRFLCMRYNLNILGYKHYFSLISVPLWSQYCSMPSQHYTICCCTKKDPRWPSGSLVVCKRWWHSWLVITSSFLRYARTAYRFWHTGTRSQRYDMISLLINAWFPIHDRDNLIRQRRLMRWIWQDFFVTTTQISSKSTLRGYCTSGPYFWRLCAFSKKIKQLWTKYPMDLVWNIPRNSKITVLLQ